jgi:hypothetical protein
LISIKGGIIVGKKQFIALAEAIREAKDHGIDFTQDQLGVLARFCRNQNHNFMWDRWMSYIKGECGPNGGRVR